MNFHIYKTDRGFIRKEFRDLYGKKCSLQESSLATDDAVWLGVDGHRMHLNRAMVRTLISHLLVFLETGSLEMNA